MPNALINRIRKKNYLCAVFFFFEWHTQALIPKLSQQFIKLFLPQNVTEYFHNKKFTLSVNFVIAYINLNIVITIISSWNQFTMKSENDKMQGEQNFWRENKSERMSSKNWSHNFADIFRSEMIANFFFFFK